LPIRRDLFAELSVVFMTHQPVLRGTGGEELVVGAIRKTTARIPSDDRRAGHGSGRQAAVLRAVAGNTADVTTLCRSSTVARSFKRRPHLRRRRPRHDQRPSIAALEERKLEYVLGVRERSSAKCAAP